MATEIKEELNKPVKFLVEDGSRVLSFSLDPKIPVQKDLIDKLTGEQAQLKKEN